MINYSNFEFGKAAKDVLGNSPKKIDKFTELARNILSSERYAITKPSQDEDADMSILSKRIYRCVEKENRKLTKDEKTLLMLDIAKTIASCL